MKVELPKVAVLVRTDGTVELKLKEPRSDLPAIVGQFFHGQPAHVTFLSDADAQLQHAWTTQIRKEGYTTGFDAGVRQERQRILSLRDTAFAGVPLDDDMKKCLRRFDELLLRGWTTS